MTRISHRVRSAFSPVLFVVTASVLFAPAAVRAQTDFDTDGETIGNVPGSARVGHNTFNTITVFTDANTNIALYLDTYNNAVLDAVGGNLGPQVAAHDNSVINFNATASSISADGSATVNIQSGDVTAGGSSLGIGANATINVLGGRIHGSVVGLGGVFNLEGGSIAGALATGQNSQVSIRKGSIGDTISFTGAAQVTWTGASIGGDIYIDNSAALVIYGSGLTATPAGSNQYANLFTLSGILLDGTDITGKTLQVAFGSDATYRLINQNGTPNDVPEPSAIAFGILAAGSVLGLVARKRKA